MKRDDELMWKATLDCDKQFDGEFFYAVKTVGVYCKPSCKSRAPLRKNVLFFESATAAQRAGFRPCKRCRPDLPEYAPSATFARNAKNLMDAHFKDRKFLAQKMKTIGLSSNRLSEIFKCEYGILPMMYLNNKRLERAKELLAQSAMPIIDIAYEIGFESLSAFYAFFKKYSAETPKNFRNNSRL